jgi:hypothetical protein
MNGGLLRLRNDPRRSAFSLQAPDGDVSVEHGKDRDCRRCGRRLSEHQEGVNDMISRLILTTVLGSLPILAGCSTIQQVEAQPPTVTYGYTGDADYRSVEARAEEYCASRYGSREVLIDRRQTNAGYEATFACE